MLAAFFDEANEVQGRASVSLNQSKNGRFTPRLLDIHVTMVEFVQHWLLFICTWTFGGNDADKDNTI